LNAVLSIGQHCDNPGLINVVKTLAINIPMRTGHDEDLSIGAKYEAEACTCLLLELPKLRSNSGKDTEVACLRPG